MAMSAVADARGTPPRCRTAPTARSAGHRRPHLLAPAGVPGVLSPGVRRVRGEGHEQRQPAAAGRPRPAPPSSSSATSTWTCVPEGAGGQTGVAELLRRSARSGCLRVTRGRRLDQRRDAERRHGSTPGVARRPRWPSAGPARELASPSRRRGRSDGSVVRLEHVLERARPRARRRGGRHAGAGPGDRRRRAPRSTCGRRGCAARPSRGRRAAGSSSTPTLRTRPSCRVHRAGVIRSGRHDDRPSPDVRIRPMRARRRRRRASGSARSALRARHSAPSSASWPDPSRARPPAAADAGWHARTATSLATDPGGLLGRRGRRRGWSASRRVLRPRADVDPGVVRRPARGSRARASAPSLLAAALHHGRGCLRGMLAASADPKAVRRYRLAGFSLHPQMLLRGVGRPARRSRSSSGCATGSPGDFDLMDSVDRQHPGRRARPRPRGARPASSTCS